MTNCLLISVTCLHRHSMTILRLPWLPNLGRAEQLLPCLCRYTRSSCGFALKNSSLTPLCLEISNWLRDCCLPASLINLTDYNQDRVYGLFLGVTNSITKTFRLFDSNNFIVWYNWLFLSLQLDYVESLIQLIVILEFQLWMKMF